MAFKPLLKRKEEVEEEGEKVASKRKGKTSKGIEKHISELQRLIQLKASGILP